MEEPAWGSAMEAERAKLERFWRQNGNKMRAVMETPLFRRLEAYDYRPIDLRHLHNKFGWQAGNNAHCVGAFYRTEAFMGLPDEGRCGTKKGQTVHIEHTVPIATLLHAIRSTRPQGSPQIATWILARSVTTAVADGEGRHTERRRIVKRGFARRSDVLTPGHGDQNFPFRRYDAESGARVWDLVSRRMVDPDGFNLADHHANLKIALDWAGLSHWSTCLAAA
ncbi:hypothetical protein [Sphingomonas pituitosa]|uniref:hypothetical protein n=1 Tax=Sphingomonas pituitosa TaxID=99597 RepID=UPI00082D8BFB|nr:hypothetical protein [Sphingomonas pituitosa]